MKDSYQCLQIDDLKLTSVWPSVGVRTFLALLRTFEGVTYALPTVVTISEIRMEWFRKRARDLKLHFFILKLLIFNYEILILFLFSRLVRLFRPSHLRLHNNANSTRGS